MQWPAVHGPVRPQNASLRLYGGAAFERCLDEFQEAAHVVQFPTGKAHTLTAHGSHWRNVILHRLYASMSAVKNAKQSSSDHAASCFAASVAHRKVLTHIE